MASSLHRIIQMSEDSGFLMLTFMQDLSLFPIHKIDSLRLDQTGIKKWILSLIFFIISFKTILHPYNMMHFLTCHVYIQGKI